MDIYTCCANGNVKEYYFLFEISTKRALAATNILHSTELSTIYGNVLKHENKTVTLG